mgnify:CR=1 FL=1
MKKIIQYLRDYIQEEWNPLFWLGLTVFLIVAITVNYTFDFETRYVAIYYRTWKQPFAYFLFYGIPYFLAIAWYLYCYQKKELWSNLKLWGLATLVMIFLGFYVSLHYYETWLQEAVAPEIYYFAYKCANNIVRPVTMFPFIAMYWWLADRKNMPLYGCSLKEFQFSTYSIMFAIMIPLVTMASFGSDFQEAYPRYRANTAEPYLQVPNYVTLGIFELCYGLDFFFVEFFFRGFMVWALARYLGIGSVMPMVIVYALIHFEKPLGETIGSIFGGWILGIIAYRTQSIFGGILIHLGVAWLMEFTAILQHSFRHTL